METNELLNYLTNLLQPNQFHDYAPNGLQVEGRAKINKIVTGVTANQALIDEAISQNADAVLVHHGFFWKGEDPRVVSIKHHRLKKLLTHDINLIAYHLPLDSHPVYGNNAQLAKLFQFNGVPPSDVDHLVWSSDVALNITGEALAKRIEEALGRTPLYIPGRELMVHSVAWCSGGAGDYIEEAIALKADAYITGEITEQVVHVARELGMHLFVAGHHATERYGVKALGEHLQKQFSLDCLFVDIDSPV